MTPPTASLSHPDTAAGAPELRLLVVDDSEAMRRFLKARIGLLLPPGWLAAVETAACGEDAVEQCRAGGFDAVFMDVVMPGMGGVEACRQIKATGAVRRVAMVSSLNTPADHDAARAAGCDDYLGKPPREDELRAVLAAVAQQAAAPA